MIGRSAVVAAALACAGVSARAVAAQSVVLDGPTGATLPSLTPAFSLRALGFGAERPLRVTLQIAGTPDFAGSLLLDSTFVTTDSTVAMQVTRLLPGETTIYWRARVSSPSGAQADSPITGPRSVPTWLTLIAPNSSVGDIFDIRRPLFVWKSARVSPLAGAWTYDVQITTQGRQEQGASGLRDTTWRAFADVQTNTSYRWSVRASVGTASVLVNSSATFLVRDQPLPGATLLYQNFPNPFPSAAAFSTCIWFDVAQPGARIALDVTDLRGNLVRTLIPGSDGQRDFQPGRYGQGLPGAGSNCDNRFVWDGTGNDGRTVAAGVYLLRFQAGRQAPSFRRMLFLGR